MNCFNHPDVPAVGICKVCQKGLCKGCAFDLGHGIACKNHREEVEMLNSYTYLHIVALALMPIGFVMILSALSVDIFMDKKEPLVQFIGTGVVFFGILFSMLGSKLRKPIKK